MSFINDDVQELGGSDGLNKGKVALIIIYAIAIFYLMFETVNISGLGQKALIYWGIVLTSLVFWGISKQISTKKDKAFFPNPIIFEDESLFFKYNRTKLIILFLIMFNIANFTFFSISASTANALVASPTFGIQPTQVSNFFDVVASAMAEDFAFFGVLLPLVAGLIYILSGNKWVGVVIALIIIPFVFMFYHSSVYTGNTVALQSVLFFGFMGALYVVIFKNMFFSLVHAANNVALLIFINSGISGLTFLFWVFLFISVGLGALFIWRDRGKII